MVSFRDAETANAMIRPDTNTQSKDMTTTEHLQYRVDELREMMEDEELSLICLN